ncbi:tyrosine-protein phosphatase [Heliophilum fasciatum]|uniref:tyrosine-protein phosphatase n=1 Tax=Heliophilum fasciatum TaxID=35700 RepID=UPI001044B632|nr:CpsB/CapC family capsule biosynthesis tyrosine phosphatase [Heliophilum fasciatum]MCW2278187.1 protein-tyrosine phosphatase [Heliophilum fasciatum]
MSEELLEYPIIDCHAHLLPDLDDGAAFWDDALIMARQAVQSGTQVMVMTPHFRQRRYDNHRKKILHQLDQFQYRLRKAAIPLTVLAGAEIAYDPAIPHLFDQGIVQSFADLRTHLLIELPFNDVPPEVDELLDQLSHRQITAIIAHPERCRPVQQAPSLLLRWRTQGVLFQLNGESLTGQAGPEAQACARQLLSMNLIDLIGSDAHHPMKRSASLAAARTDLLKHLPPAQVQAILYSNAAALLQITDPS